MHLVIDANAFIKGSVFRFSKENLYTVPEVLQNEVRDKLSRTSLESFPHVSSRSPSRESLEFVIKLSRKTGDYAALSQTDIRLLALIVDLERECNNGSVSHLRSEPVSIRTSFGGALAKDESEDKWITPQNIKDTQQTRALKDGNTDSPLVACITSDFAMQNVAMHIGLNLVTENGVRIQRLKHWVLRCHVCSHLEKNPSRRFCEKCGNYTLIKTSVSIDADSGEMTIYLKKDFQYNNRGTIYPIPTPKGGGSAFFSRSKTWRTNRDLILREDQKEYIREHKAFERTLKRTIADPDLLPSLMATASIRESYESKFKISPPTVGYGRVNVNQVRPKRA